MSLLGTLAAQALTNGLKLLINHSGETEFAKSVEVMKLTGIALQELSEKVADKQITEEEIDDVIADLEASGDTEVIISVKAAVSRIIEMVFK